MVRVQVQQGWLEGEELKSKPGGTRYFSFKGIPFAAPPVGELRFQAPQPAKTWEGVRKATKHGPVAPQIDVLLNQYLPGDEDCLFLNVYSPDISPETHLPVMVYIHAGGFKTGSGNDSIYGPDFLMNHDIVLVTINYRLDILGFLCLDTKEAPGNAGLKDQVAALKWVQHNIKNFGGDPDNVTIFGNSAGGCAVTLHMLSPMSKGLFKRAIAMSGSPFNEWSFTLEPKRHAMKLASALGCKSKDDQVIFKFFQKAPVINILNKFYEIMMSEKSKKSVGRINAFSPVIEKDLGLDHFLTEDPLDIIKRGDINEADFVTGYTDNELLTFMTYIEGAFGHAINFPTEFVPHQICCNVSPKKCLEISDKVVNYYFGSKMVGLDDMNKFFGMFNDVFMRYSTHSFIRHMCKANKCMNYLYMLSCVTERNIFTKSGKPYNLTGAAHLEDLWYLFNPAHQKFHVKVDVKSKSYQCIQRSCKLFTNFAKFGNPTPDSSLGATWPEYDNETMQYIDIGEELNTGSGLGREILQFWDEIFEDIEST